MNFSHFFIDRPIFATVISVIIVLVGTLSYFALPVDEYPDVALPTIVVNASYTGATPEVIAETVAAPLEQQINGVEDMLYMESSSTSDGKMQLKVTFALGTDVDQAQVLVQNRVSVAEPKLPPEARQVGVTTDKTSPQLLMVIHLTSPDGSRTQNYITNYTYLQIRDVLARLNGVGSLTIAGGSEYSMRIWLDVEKLPTLDLTPGDVVAALKEQNVQVAAGVVGQPPIDQPGAFQLQVASRGRLKNVDEFGDVVIKSDEAGRLVRLSDVARIELGAVDYSLNSYLDGKKAIAILVYQRPGSNGVETSHEVQQTMAELKETFPDGVDYDIVYNPMDFVEQSIEEVFTTLFISAALVILTVFIFLQGWQATIIPVVAIPVSLIGTFGAMQIVGFSLNNLSLFGLVLAIGVVVDDAIVVVENVERLIADGHSPRKAARMAMSEISGALVATTLVLIAVFVPTAFMPGISGQFYRQFAITISFSTAISTIVSLTLSPALCAMLLQPKGAKPGLLTRLVNLAFGWFFVPFNYVFDHATNLYAGTVRTVLRVSFIALIAYGGMIFMAYLGFKTVPTGFIPIQDKGYLIVSVELPRGASLSRTDEIMQELSEIALETPGVAHTVTLAGLSGATLSNSSNAGAIFVVMTEAKQRAKDGLGAPVVLGKLSERFQSVIDASVFVIPPPPVNGVGSAGGFKMIVQDRSGSGFDDLNSVTNEILQESYLYTPVVNRDDLPEDKVKPLKLDQVFTTFNSDTPQYFADIDRTKAQMLNVPMSNVFETLQIYLGSLYVNDFNILGRTYRVTAQAESEFRDEASDIYRFRTRSSDGAIVSLGSLVTVQDRTAPDRVVRYNLYPSADINGSAFPGVSTGESIALMESIAEEKLPPGFGYEWTDLAYQEKAAGNTAAFIFPLCVLFVFLSLSAQYESWILPLAVILIVPLCLLFGIAGVWLRSMDNNVLTQIGFVVLVGLACKNAILIVEFAKQLEDEGKSRMDAAVTACRLRLRAILMTAFSFILGTIPLLVATGAGAEMRQALGTAVFSGMLGVTVLGLFMTPTFYVVLRWASSFAGSDQPKTDIDDDDSDDVKTSAIAPETTAEKPPVSQSTTEETDANSSDDNQTPGDQQAGKKIDTSALNEANQDDSDDESSDQESPSE